MTPSIDGSFPMFAVCIVIAALAVLAPIAGHFSNIRKNNRREPPLEQELYKDFVRRHELDLMRTQFCEQMKGLDDRHQKTAGEIFDVLRSLKHDLGQQSTRIEESLSNVSRELGKIDGRLQGHIENGKG